MHLSGSSKGKLEASRCAPGFKLVVKMGLARSDRRTLSALFHDWLWMGTPFMVVQDTRPMPDCTDFSTGKVMPERVWLQQLPVR